MSKNDLETQDLIRTNEDYFSLFPEFVPYSDEFFFDSPILESYSTDTTSSSPMLQQEDGFFKPLEAEEPLTMNDPLQIQVLGVPKEGGKSRVETQIKLRIQLSTKHANQWSFIRINKDMLVKSKIRKSEQKPRQGSLSSLVEFSDESKILNLEAKVVHSNTDQPIQMCEGCIRRERKRSERIKDGRPREEGEQNAEKEKNRILLFNCNSLLNFSSSEITLPTRITCYCRHHNEKVGFRICFVMKNDKEKTVATGISPPIMITDDHKNPKNKANSNRKKRSRESDGIDPATPKVSRKFSIPNKPITSPYLPTSINVPHSDPIFINALPTPPAEQLPFKRRRNTSPLLFSSLLQDRPPPCLDRIVPAQGPTYGGIEVTLLGSGFHQGLICLFGDRPATITAVYPNTMVCVLPPAPHPGPVVVSFKDHSLVLEGQDVVIFTYYDASDQALLELALQLIGLKTTGKLQNAKHVAMNIVHGDFYQSQQSNSQQNQEMIHDVLETNMFDFQTLSQTNENKHNLLHLATLVRNKRLLNRLLGSVTKAQDRLLLLNARDRNGMTPLDFACQLNCIEIAQSLLLAGSHPYNLRPSLSSGGDTNRDMVQQIYPKKMKSSFDHYDHHLFPFRLQVMIASLGLFYVQYSAQNHPSRIHHFPSSSVQFVSI
ncbi:hypothetical protein G6F56_002199 [Rhizopus delemar]|nr:hypothetical protein G6F56_002199 [Rhizopus delemar]